MGTMISSAVIAVTLNCNSRCVMCNIWQNRMKNEVKPEFYQRLPRSLREINITGGEPFLRQDLGEIVRVMKQRCPRARILINTNGFLPEVMEKRLPEMLQHDPNLALRVSIDGWKKKQTEIRGIPRGFEKCLKSLKTAKRLGVKDLGVAVTLMRMNVKDMVRLFKWSRKNRWEFSLTLATDSPIYFGKNKEKLRPDDNLHVRRAFEQVVRGQRKSGKPKDWFKAWFNSRLYGYLKTNKRPLACEAGTNWVYIDSLGRVYACQMKPWLMGDLRKTEFKKVMMSRRAEMAREKVRNCEDCWMVCSARTSMRRRIGKVGWEAVKEKFVGGKPV